MLFFFTALVIAQNVGFSISVCEVKQRTSIHSLAGMYECALRGTVLRTEQEGAALLRRRWRLSPVSAIRQVNRRL